MFPLVGVVSRHEDDPLVDLPHCADVLAGHAVEVIEDYFGRWFGAEDPVRFVNQAFDLEKFLVDEMDAIRAWFLPAGRQAS